MFFCLKSFFLADTCPLFRATGTPVLDFWWRYSHCCISITFTLLSVGSEPSHRKYYPIRKALFKSLISFILTIYSWKPLVIIHSTQMRIPISLFNRLKIKTLLSEKHNMITPLRIISWKEQGPDIRMVKHRGLDSAPRRESLYFSARWMIGELRQFVSCVIWCKRFYIAARTFQKI